MVVEAALGFFQIKLIRRDANGCADKLAKMGHDIASLTIFYSPLPLGFFFFRIVFLLFVVFRASALRWIKKN